MTRYRTLSLVLIITILFSSIRGFASNSKENLEKVTIKGEELGLVAGKFRDQEDIKKNSKEDGKTDGSTFGGIMGRTFGIKDYYEGGNADYNKNMPKESEIRRDYFLYKNNSDYSEGFINGFKKAYEESYIKSFREAKNNIILLEDSSAYENGKDVGEIQGRVQGNIDYVEKKNNDWTRSKIYSGNIISEYNLIYQTSKYINSFINGYLDGYSKAYTETYKELSQGGAMAKTICETIGINGGTVRSLDGGFTVELDKGTYYKPVILTIDTLNDNYFMSDKYVVASNCYRVNVINPSGISSKDKQVRISFEYYGNQDGGIYELENGKWKYLTSTIEDNNIVANINPATIKLDGNSFAVLIDAKTKIFHDIRGHWAKDEITAYIRRGVINGYPDKKFKPDQHITRVEFLTLLSRLYEWDLPNDISNNELFKDYKTFNKYNEKYISYSLSHGYITGYSDKYFRPYNNISYKEVDDIMKKILMDSSFKWEKYAEQMIYDKKIRSSSYDSYSNNITRAELCYMLYKLNE